MNERWGRLTAGAVGLAVVITGVGVPMAASAQASPEYAAVAAAAAFRPPLDPTDPAIQGEKMPASHGLPTAASQFAVAGSPGTYRLPRPAAGGTSTGTVPAGLEQFYSQKVTWTSCKGFSAPGTLDLSVVEQLMAAGPAGWKRLEDAFGAPDLQTKWKGIKFTCAYVIVPVDYSKPNGPTAAIAVSRASTGLAADGKAKHGLFGNSGGPGQASLPFGAQWAAEFRDVLTDYDIVSPDTRGAGASLPQIRCATDTFFQAQTEGMDGLHSTPEGIVKADQVNKANTEACYTNTGAGFQNADGTAFSAETYIPKVSVDDEARDMDVIRSLIGNEKLSYQGGSDGTGVGYTYAQEFPENTRAMVLDSPENPFSNNAALAAKYEDITGHPEVDPYEQSKGFQDTFYQFAETCAKENGFDVDGTKVPCALGTDPNRAKLMAAYQAISQKAFGGTTYGSESLDRPLSFADFTQATTSAMYSTSSWPQLNAGLAAAKANGDVEDLLALRDSYYQYEDGTYPFFVNATFPTISCQNFDSGSTSTAAGAYAAAPFQDPGKDPSTGKQRDGLDSKYGWCDWYHTKDQKAKAQEVKALPNILVVASSHDPATPYVGGVLMAKGLGATLLTVENPQHIAVGQVACATDIAVGYLKTLVPPTDIPGETGIPVLDLTQRPIDPSTNKNVIGNECRVDSSNRPTPKVAALTAAPGADATVTADGLVRGAKYTVAIVGPDGKPIATGLDGKTFSATADGTLSAPVSLPAGLAPGAYKVVIAGVEDVNKPIAVSPGALTIKVAAPAALKVAKASVPAGASQTVTGSGFAPGATVTLELHSTPIALGTVKADANGSFSKTFTVPTTVAAGAHTVVATADGATARAAFTVTTASKPIPSGGTGGDTPKGSGNLAVTGAEAPAMPFLAATLLLVAGGALLVARRRARTTRS